MNKIIEVTLFRREDESGYSRNSVRVCTDGSPNCDSFDTSEFFDSARGRDYELGCIGPTYATKGTHYSIYGGSLVVMLSNIIGIIGIDI
jgi:hypothetical protein